MTFLTIIAVLILGLLILAIGFIAKKRWIQLASLIPLGISGWHILHMLSI